MDQNTRIFGIGLSKTGTVSLTKALTILGIKAEHFPEDKTTQEELKRGQYQLSVLRNTQALLDIPVAPYYAQFDRLLPDAKFILTTRPSESWLQSMDAHYKYWVEYHRDAYNDFVQACVYGTLHFSAERFLWVKEVHEANVRRHFADRPQKLLIFDIFTGDGWPELCRFLDLPIPDVPYPHANKKRSAPAKPPTRSLFHRLRRLIG